MYHAVTVPPIMQFQFCFFCFGRCLVSLLNNPPAIFSLIGESSRIFAESNYPSGCVLPDHPCENASIRFVHLRRFEISSELIEAARLCVDYLVPVSGCMILSISFEDEGGLTFKRNVLVNVICGCNRCALGIKCPFQVCLLTLRRSRGDENTNKQDC